MSVSSPPARPAPANPSSARALISAHGGRATPARTAIVELLQDSSQPLSQDDISAALKRRGLKPDRATLYRALDWLLAQGIAERIASGERAWHFELKRAEQHRHAHFHCEHCGEIRCLDNLVTVVEPQLPQGFSLSRSEWVLYGACAHCNPAPHR